jgi:hypothetical protein
VEEVKAFSPKPFEPGAPIAWRHYFPDGRVVERTGTVWDRCPTVQGTSMVAWAVPDVPLDSDVYRGAVPVGKANGRSVAVHGMYLDLETGHDQWARKGECYSSNYAGSPLGALAITAVRAAGRNQAGRAA